MIVNVNPRTALKTCAAALAMTLLAACGQTGPLYLPKPPAKQASAPSAPATPPPSTPAAQQ